MTYARYAIYYVPTGALADFGAAWFGWDIRDGTSRLTRLQVAGLPNAVECLTARPRKYGLHATLKAPFRLSAETDVAALSDDLATLAMSLPPVRVGGLHLTRPSSFLALTPRGDAVALGQLAGTLVEHLDRHRAPLAEDELAKRRRAHLSAEEARMLTRWGYPYVMDRFRFHITLTDSIPDAHGDRIAAALAPVLDPLCAPPFTIGDVGLVGEGEDGMFRLIRRFQLRG